MVCQQMGTRFNPSCTGPMHIGHLYTLLVNEQYAHERGGQFTVRFDDSVPFYYPQLGERLYEIRERMREDIEWLGVRVDRWSVQSEMVEEAHKRWAEVGYTPHPFDPNAAQVLYVSKQRQEGWLNWGHHPYLTAERVWFDHWDGVTHVIRGEELALEYNLYLYLCDEFHIPRPVHIYLPRVESSRGDISKTAGGYTIGELRSAGYSPADIIDILLKGCCISPANRFALFNLKAAPRIAL